VNEGDLVPDVSLPATTGEDVPLRRDGVAIFFVFPKAGREGVVLPADWGKTPGMQGCTAQSCAFRDIHDEVRAMGAEIFGVSTQTPDEQRAFASSLGLPYVLLSDPDASLDVPTVAVNDSVVVYRRLTFIAVDGVVRKIFFPVEVPDANPHEVLAWLADHRMSA
jgi:peroxiredoxin